MFALFRKVLFALTLNAGLLLLLIIGLQNNESKSQVKLIIGETVTLPVGFIIGISFITGSISGSLITINSKKR
tara:strand:+ start:449 stop:667 length:219 start_codon:yes stop_codon:yes gene_type:complete